MVGNNLALACHCNTTHKRRALQFIIYHYYQRIGHATHKKTRPTGYDASRHKRRPLMQMQIEKTSKLLPHPCTPVARVRAGWRIGHHFPCALACRQQAKGFFNLSLTFAPTGSRTQELRSATEATNQYG